ncbi:hypothetical protein FHG87_013803 [Trinorchestia longiramus]|nr:hypothetical protein FHG87_013803 [Trinorchestia longiramus]
MTVFIYLSTFQNRRCHKCVTTNIQEYYSVVIKDGLLSLLMDNNNWSVHHSLYWLLWPYGSVQHIVQRYSVSTRRLCQGLLR